MAAGSVADDPALLAALLDDAAKTSELWTATPYWRGYCGRILRALSRRGLVGFRSDPAIVKGYAASGLPQPTLPRAAWKRALWHGLERLPVFALIVAEYTRLARAEAAHRREAEIRLARMALDAVADRCPGFAPPPGLANGNAWDAFQWRGVTVTAEFALHAARVADFYGAVPARELRRMIEIGPGLGLSALAHKALNPNLEVVVHVDIVPIVYVSSQFLASIPGIAVVNYLATRGVDRIAPEPRGGFTVYQLPPWQLPQLEPGLDFFFNAFSFQEMEPEICANYAKHLSRVVAKGGLLHSSVSGHKPGAGGQRKPVTLADLEALFAPAFPRVAQLDGLWPRYFDGAPEQTRLMRK